MKKNQINNTYTTKNQNGCHPAQSNSKEQRRSHANAYYTGNQINLYIIITWG
ncbi:MAG: hypothetical protein V1904_06655 [Bacteroidota bacterium]